MKLKTIYILFIGLLGVVLFMGNSNGRADGAGWGNTGAPGDQVLSNGSPRTCQSCHATGNTQVTLDINLLDEAGDAISDYMPGQTYDVSVVLNHAGGDAPSGYGFQALSLIDSDESDVAGWSEPGANVKISTASNTGRSYAEQNGVSTENTFNFKWTAPADGSGSVTFYSCGNGVNDNGATSGDGAACTTLTVGEAFGVSTKEIANTLNLEVFPNPVNDILNLRFDVVLGGTYTVNMYNALGQLVQTKVQDAYTGENIIQLNCEELGSGIHLLRLENEKNVLTRKVYVD